MRKSIIPAESTTENADYSSNQSMLENADRQVWQGEHPIHAGGVHNLGHKLEVSTHVPRIYHSTRKV